MKRLLLFLCFIGLSYADEQTSRTWTSSDGKAVEGILEEADGAEVRLRTPRGVFKFPLTKLSEADQKYIADWKANKPLKIGPWPEAVEVRGEFEVKDVSVGDKFLYQTPHFEFHAPIRLSESVVRDFSRIFEATYEGVKALPVGFDPIPPGDGHFKTTLFETREDYFSAGGMEGSGGMFRWSSRGGEYVSGEIMVPLTSLGVERVGNRFKIDYDKDSGTLTHEIVHQVAVRWSILGVPVWFSEGLAEYIQAAPYSKGTMRFTSMPRAVEAQVMERSSESKFQMVPLAQLLTITRDEWATALTTPGGASRNYNSAAVLVTYFLHMDGEGDGMPVAAYLKALSEGAEPAKAMEEHLIRERDPAKMEEVVGDAWRQNGMRVEFR